LNSTTIAYDLKIVLSISSTYIDTIKNQYKAHTGFVLLNLR